MLCILHVEKRLRKMQENCPEANVGTMKSAKSAVGLQLFFLKMPVSGKLLWKTRWDNHQKPNKTKLFHRSLVVAFHNLFCGT